MVSRQPFYFGVDYYPEQWPEDRWATDAQWMAEAGFNLARLGEFAWAKMEPVEGRFDFSWLERAIATLSAHGLRVMLGTPTAAPPAWLAADHPGIFRVRKDGVRVAYGNRRGYCPTSREYRAATERIVGALAAHFAGHPALAAWQVDNEFGGLCYCSSCARSFHAWLEQRYGTLEELNRRWGTAFWGQVYDRWDEIPLPLDAGSAPNPGLALDYYRFSSAAYREYQQLQISLLRHFCPDVPILHNFQGGFDQEELNFFELAQPLDVAAWNNYPRTQWDMRAEVDANRMALSLDLMRGLKRAPFWITEQQAGPGGWEMVSVPPRPGELRLWAYQTIAHGAEAVLFFRWRTARFGTEQYWHGLLDHDGSRSRRYHEIQQMGREIARIRERLTGLETHARVAMLMSYDSRFAFNVQGNNPGFSYPHHFARIYNSFHARNVAVDVLPPEANLEGYQLVVAPSLHVLPEEIARNLRNYVRSGGILMVTMRSGVKNEFNAVVDERLPGLLADVCGVTVEEYDSLPPDAHNQLDFISPELAGAQVETCNWADILEPRGAVVVARYTRDYYAGKPAITLNHYGAGFAVYVGTDGDERLYNRLSDWLLDLAGVEPVLSAPPGVEICERCRGGTRLLFVLNHTHSVQQVELDGSYKDLLNGERLRGQVTVGALDVRVMEQEQ